MSKSKKDNEYDKFHKAIMKLGGEFTTDGKLKEESMNPEIENLVADYNKKYAERNPREAKVFEERNKTQERTARIAAWLILLVAIIVGAIAYSSMNSKSIKSACESLAWTKMNDSSYGVTIQTDSVEYMGKDGKHHVFSIRYTSTADIMGYRSSQSGSTVQFCRKAGDSVVMSMFKN